MKTIFYYLNITIIIYNFIYLGTKCNRKIMEGFGCIAMDNTYHIKCFTCTCCGDQLKGNPFYHINSMPYCEKDYLVSMLHNIYIYINHVNIIVIIII